MINKYAAPVIAQISEVRRSIAAASPQAFAQTYLTSLCNLPLSRMHEEVFATLHNITTKRGAHFAVAAPRGHAKSTIVSLAYVLWCALYEKEKLIVIVSATKPQAELLLNHVKEQLQKNKRLLEDFPKMCHPEGASRRPKPWRDNRIKLPNSTLICAYGVGQSLRGARNEKHRPGLIIADDLEIREHVIVEEQRHKLREWFDGTLMHAGHPETNTIVVGTILHHDSLLANLMESSKRPGWIGKRYQAIECFSAHPELWEKWTSIFGNREEYNGATGPDAARAYFDANQSLMLTETKVLWPERESYFELMVMREREGRASFQSEKQNEPLDPDECIFRQENFSFWDSQFQDEQYLLNFLKNDARFFGACDPSLGKKTGGDFSGIVIVAQDRNTKINYVLVADIKRRSPDQTVERIAQYTKMYRMSRFGVEANNFQQLMIDNLKARLSQQGTSMWVEPITSRSNKLSRIAALEPDISQGKLMFSRKHQELLSQLYQFPVGLHDDGPDALEMAVTMARKGSAGGCVKLAGS